MSNMNVLMHNMQAMFSNRQLGITNNNRAKSSEKLSSGFRINRAADDAAGLTISEKMRSQIRGLHQGTKNTQDGVSWIQIGDGAMDEVTDMLHRMTELSVKASNGTLTEQDRAAINEEVMQLKNEINRVGTSTEFNTKPIFDNSYAMLDIDGVPDNLQIFDAKYDSGTGAVQFGGIIFNNERISWDSINPNMVTVDDAGKQIFVGGNYEVSIGGESLKFHCNDGAEIPNITAQINIEADANDGIFINGKQYNWSELVDENGNGCSSSNAHSGNWSLNYHGADVGIYIPEVSSGNLNKIAEGINNMSDGIKTTYTWQIQYTGQTPEKAVDTGLAQNMRISKTLADALKKDETYVLNVSCDETGIRLKDKSGTILDGSEKTWSDLGIDSWDSGDDISSNKTYKYSYYDPSDSSSPYISFDLNLSDVTSIDSVIDGLNGMQIKGSNITTNYKPTVNMDSSQVDCLQNFNPSIDVSFSEEVLLGRDFNDKNGYDQTSHITINGNMASVTFSNAKTGDEVITLTGDISSAQSALEDKVSDWWDVVENRKTLAVLAGNASDDIIIGSLDLADIVDPDNTGKITRTGNLTERLTLTSDFFPNHVSDGKVTTNSGRTSVDIHGSTTVNSYNKLRAGVTYSAGKIDFSEISDLNSLIGTGFDSTCAGCNGHYSVLFVSGITDADETNTGYRYKLETEIPSGKSLGSTDVNQLLKIDISSLKEQGVDKSNIADALLKITDECYDYHYQQYAAQNSIFYVVEREGTIIREGSPNGTFSTHPYSYNTEEDVRITLGNSSGDSIGLGYDQYDYSKSSGNVHISMEEDDSGEYIKRKDIDGIIGGYYKYEDIKDSEGFDLSDYECVSSDPTSLKKYSLNKKYLDADGNEADRTTALSSVTSRSIQDLLSATSVTLQATNYSYINLNTNENDNVAIRANFISQMTEKPYQNGIDIVHSGFVHGNSDDDITTIPRFPMNTFAMGLRGVNTSTQDSAKQALAKIQNAVNYVTDCRSTYGAYQNRLEHTLRNNENKEENTTAAESRIRDTDMAEEISRFTKDGILQQASQSILAQANQNRQGILSLLS